MRALSAGEVIQIWEQGRDRHPVDRALLLLAVGQPNLAPETLASLTMGQRNHRLLEMRQATIGDALDGLATCPQCRETLEFSTRVSDLLLPEPDQPAFTLQAEDYQIRYRPPDSRDLVAILGSPDHEAARDRLLQRCVQQVTQGDQEIPLAMLPAALLVTLGEDMLNQDQQAEMRFAFVCPACSHQWSALFDIVSFLWAELAARAQRLLLEVHQLARAYGWPEADILSMSSQRRHAYLEMIHA